MNDRFESLEQGEVISVQQEIQVLSGQRTFRAGELNDAIKHYLASAIAGWSEEKNGWFSTQGIDCEALRFGSNGWQKGRIRLSLEFCPDEPNPAAQSASSSNVPAPTATTVATVTPASSPATQVSHDSFSDAESDRQHSASQFSHSETRSTTVSTATPVPDIAPHPHETPISTIPVVGVAAVGAVAVAAAAIAAPERLEANPDLTVPHLTDAVLELEEHYTDASAPPSGGLDEIAFDFDRSNDGQGRMIPNGMMELDLTDLGLDFAEHDLLNFEANGMSDPAEEFGNLHDLGKPENSGMLIDEVWNEMNQGNWPGIN